MGDEQAPFMRMPSDIRLMICDLLLGDKHKTLELWNESSEAYHNGGVH